MINQPMMYSMHQMLLEKEKNAANTVYLRQPRHNQWQEYTWAQVMLAARKLAGFLQGLGLKKGAHIGIISKNCAEWFITDFGIALAGMVSVPLFANQHQESIHYVLEHADVQLVFVGKLDDHNVVRSYIPSQYPTICFDYHEDLQCDYKWDQLMAAEPLVDIVEPQPEDLYTLIYSSGTTGNPKGAMYTHQTVANYLALFPKDLKRIRDLDFYKLVSYLPLAHVYERSAIELSSIVIPSEISFIESMDKFLQNMQSIQPSFFTAVPRIWGVFQQKLEQKIPPKKLKILLKIPLVSLLLKRKIKSSLGLNNCVNFFSGASFLPVTIASFFEQLGIVIQDGYGQTENLAYATVSLLSDRKPGYVGKARVDVELKLSQDNELLLRSPCLMTGYYKDLQATKAAFTEDSWLRTGDIIEMDSEGRVKILGRISENFKNQSGEFVCPSAIEKRFANFKLIEQLCIVGRGLPTNLLFVNLDATAHIGKDKQDTSKLLQEYLHKVNEQLVRHEKIGTIIVTKNTWTPENGLLTPTLKVKRKELEQQYDALIQKALKEHTAILWEQ